MLELRDEEGISLDEMAVLYRAHYHSMELQMELTRRGIPYEVRSGIKFFEQAHIKDVTGYLKVMVNPRDELAWKRILRLIPRIGKVSSEKIWNYIQSLPEPFSSITPEGLVPLINKNVLTHLNRFTHTLRKLYRPELLKSPAEMIELVMEEGYEEYLQSKYPNFEARIEDIKQLRQFALQYSSAEDFLSELALLSGMEAEDVVGGGYEDERVKLSTVHQAKGLEWSVVFVIWLCEGRFPSMRSLKTKEDEEEERRLFYVSVTRAKDHLYLCYPILAYDYNQPSILLRPSRFIQEIPDMAYEKWVVDED
jgi:DNA helicase-2/ATP-dependent DNA helicase PcrA